ncbi:MAG: hypothetical protein ABIP77_09430 [Candidatus Limnocylindrales bacterium]
MSVDIVNGRLLLGASSPVESNTLAALSKALSVPIQVTVEPSDPDLHCTLSRDHCNAPMKAGNKIRRGTSTSSNICTMGFHIRVGGDEQFLTAGHCGFQPGFDEWYHQGYSGIFAAGVALKVPLAYRQSGFDFMRLQMPDTEVSDDIFDSSQNITGSAYPIVGQIICASMAMSNQVDCGSVTVANTTWTSQGCACLVSGGGYTGIAAIVGDSGSPIYALGGGSSEPATAIGMVNTLTHFARVKDALSFYGATLVT